MSDKQKECIAVFVEFVVSGIMSVIFLALATLSFIWRHWCVMGYGIANGLVFVYYAVKRARRYFDLKRDAEDVDYDMK